MVTPTMVTINGDLAPDMVATAITFRIPAAVAPRYNSGPDVILPGTEYSAVVAADGTFSLQVPGSNDPQWTPANWTYEVYVRGPNLNWRQNVQTPYDQGSLNFSSILPALTPSEGEAYAPLNHSHGGGG